MLRHPLFNSSPSINLISASSPSHERFIPFALSAVIFHEFSFFLTSLHSPKSHPFTRLSLRPVYSSSSIPTAADVLSFGLHARHAICAGPKPSRLCFPAESFRIEKQFSREEDLFAFEGSPSAGIYSSRAKAECESSSKAAVKWINKANEEAR